jgi:chromosome segregation ATPase
MKKNILSIITAGFLISGFLTNAMASDTSSLTKATVKLIKENRAMAQDVLSIQSQHDNLNSKIEQNKVLIKNISDENNQIIGQFNSMKDQVQKVDSTSTINSKSINELNNYKISSSNDLKTLDLRISELAKKIGMSQENLEKINSNSSKTSNISVSTKQEVEQLKKEFEDFKKNASFNLTSLSKQTTGDNASIFELNKHLKTLEGENKILKEQLENYKIFTDSELKILKTKLDRAKPVYFMQEKEVKAECTSGNCQNSNDVDDVIKNFIK